VEKTRRERIATMGSGPSRLAAASDMADPGYGVTIFERCQKLGKMPSSAIPTYRLPREALEEDIKYVLAKGVEEGVSVASRRAAARKIPGSAAAEMTEKINGRDRCEALSGPGIVNAIDQGVLSRFCPLFEASAPPPCRSERELHRANISRSNHRCPSITP